MALGDSSNPLIVAIVGSGPSGFYAAEALLKSDLAVQVNMLESLPTPYGLVRSGVAPDHQKLKQVISLYEKIATHEQFQLFANVKVGEDISIEELHQSHHAVILSYGTETDRKLNIGGEDKQGSHTATEFVGWYNGHPNYQNCTFNLNQETAVIIGQGNVAADVARILAKTVDELKHTDITEHALATLAASKIKEIHVIGRRGPAQAKFTAKELREFGELAYCDPIVNIDDLPLNANSEQELADPKNAGNKKVFDLFQGFANRSADKQRKCYFHFLLSPKEILGNDQVDTLVLEKNTLAGEAFAQSAQGTGELVEFSTGLVFRSIGYHGVAMPDVPFDQKRGIIPNQQGQVNSKTWLYVTGWIKRGPSGIIGTNRACSVATVNTLLTNLEPLTQPTTDIDTILNNHNINHINLSDWQKINEYEISKGTPKGKPREKLTTTKAMLEVAFS